uniref:Methyltransferase n=1 Tax=viral metagenome TaxID=1070528 RepID=A0A6H1ZUQ9_9ZZZZ
MKIEIIKQNGFNFLWINNYLWMWDIPVEKEIQKRMSDGAYGSVLVAGYGLGIIQQYLFQNKKVTSFITIEKYPEIEKLCRETYGEIYGSIIVKDFFEYNTVLKFDCIIGDIWEDIIPESLNKYKQFKKQAKKFLKPSGRIIAWGQEFFEYLIEKEKL